MKPVFVILASLMVGVALFAQEEGGPPSGGGRPPMVRYDSSKETTLQGAVTAVRTETRGPGAFVVLTVAADGRTLDVFAGPEALLKRQGVTFAKDDAVTAVGVAMENPDGTVFVARTITRGETVVTLLDAQGRPVGRP